MGCSLGVVGFIVGTMAGQLVGAWTYLRTKRRGWREAKAAASSGIATALIAAAVYVLFGVHDWAGGNGSSPGVSVFLAVCAGLVQGVLFRGRPLTTRA